ncbi:MAG TPA: pyridoxal-phosphate dependent enzyme, partial [Calditrichaeota bacterium]|nr:pyridoxal-phosphate dependent enzyme [Calditrichota bacterium]
AILVRSPIYGDRVVEVLKATGGSAVAVSDEEMFKAEREVARLEGLFVEPSSSSTVAVIPRLLEEGLIKPEELVVCILTGSGLKAPSISEFLSVRRRAVEVPRETSMKMRVLTVLSRGERHGYAVWRLLKKAVSLQAVYQHLKDLERRGYVESTRLNGRRVYRLTEEGRLLLKAFRIIRGR